ncbi:MAG: hypothetical protein EAZ35_10105 [Sphingobacteriia bacterium]|nr:MAG: hypothetical protein EAZ41_07335 [Sphingobacteriia bacterium]TAG29686.1 MAG: hypothetical protein EAZ35_10105 [Sphingobacteriia bacterium]
MKNPIKSIFALAFILWAPRLQAQQSPNYEFRGVWVASVENIDWPAKRNLSVAEQKSSFIRLLDLHQSNGMNAIVMQVRPSGDALYPSQYEPWSEYLTGKQGLPPTPYYDPLEFMIIETHKRGMEFHAWLNPYRAVFNIFKSSVSPSHITKIHPEWFLVYGDKKYFNPGLPAVREHTVRVVKDLVNRYDIDAIHMDDYFYPYRIAGKEFPDQASFEQYGGGLKKDDWRRSNCDSIIVQLQHAIHSTNPRVKFGISPFGVWRNKSQDPMGSNTKAGQTNYDDLYADILLWLKKGWIDYVTPQLYWERGHKLADYDVLLKWWNENGYGKHIYIGMGIYRAGSNDAWKDKNQIPYQIQELRNFHTTQGSIYFSSKIFEKNPNGWNDSLRTNYYRYPALVPPMAWLNNDAPEQPVLEKKSMKEIEATYNGTLGIKGFGIFVLARDQEIKFINSQLVQLIITDKTALIDLTKIPAATGNRICIATIDINNNVSALMELN